MNDGHMDSLWHGSPPSPLAIHDEDGKTSYGPNSPASVTSNNGEGDGLPPLLHAHCMRDSAPPSLSSLLTCRPCYFSGRAMYDDMQSTSNGDGEVDITEFDITESDVTFFQEIDITESDVTKKGN